MDHYRFPPPPPPPPPSVEEERKRQAWGRAALIAALVVGVPMAAVFLAAMATGLITTLGL